DTPYVDLSTLVSFGYYDLAPNDTVCAIKILSTSRDGLTYMEEMVDYAETLILDNGLECDLCRPSGDANSDESINVGDAVWMINYVFKGGDAPICYGEGDANGDCALNVGDAVYLINYVFKSGPAPICSRDCINTLLNTEEPELGTWWPCRNDDTHPPTP
ncbi:MAG: hypothetical protein GY841_05585, partial [FCB group bacterium]|nr:hypothetical protein [FCB group bacterium]